MLEFEFDNFSPSKGMNEESAIGVLRDCKPLYQRFYCIPGYKPSQHEKYVLLKLEQLYLADLADDENLLEAAEIDLKEVAYLLGALTIAKLDLN